MGTLLRSRILWMILVLFVFLGLFVMMARYFFALTEKGKKNPRILPAAREQEKNTPTDVLPNIHGTESIVVPQQNFNGPIIRYKDHRFTPATSAVKYHAQISCVIQIVNEGQTPLIIRLSPHSRALKGNWGGQYEPIAPGGFLNLDPRFDIGRPSFHNHEHPKEEFTIVLDHSCRNDL